jgi:hypothetical protein
VLKDLQEKEFEIKTENGNWYSMRILPYKTIENTIDGVVITFMDIAQRKKADHLLTSRSHPSGLRLCPKTVLQGKPFPLKMRTRKPSVPGRVHLLYLRSCSLLRGEG